jgi:hypothetical protein
MNRRFLAREERQRLVLLSQSWSLRAQNEKNAAILSNNSTAIRNAITAADQAELHAERFERAELVLADIHRDLIRTARRGRPLGRRSILRLADQLDSVHDLLKRPE